MSTPTPDYAAQQLKSTQWNAQIIEANARAQSDAVKSRAASMPKNELVPDWLQKPVEWVGSKIRSVYTNVLSRPLTTALLAGQLAKSEDASNNGGFGKIFDSNIWDKAYMDAKHVSPGQAAVFTLENFGSTREELNKSLHEQVMYKPKDESGKPVIDPVTGKQAEINLNESGILWDNPDAVQQRFSHGVEKWASGGLDLAVSWYADPLVLTGKVAGVAREVAYVRPAQVTGEKTFAGAALSKVSGGKLGQPKTVDNVSRNIESSAFNSMGNFIEKQKVKLQPGPTVSGVPTTSGSRFEDWVTKQAWAKNSADGGAIAAQLGKAANRSELDDVLAISMGDKSRVIALQDKNTELAAMAKQLERQKSILSGSLPANASPAQGALIAQHIADISDDISNIGKQSSAIGDKIALSDTMKSGMYFNGVTSPLASKLGQFTRELETKKIKDSFGMSLAYNNLFVRPLRVVTGTTWNGIRPNGHIDLHDANSHRELGAQLDVAKVYSQPEQAAMVSTYIKATPAQRGVILQRYDAKTVERLAAKHGLDQDEAAAIYGQLGAMKGAAQNGRIYSTATIDSGTGGRLRADHIADDGSIVAVSPVLNSQLENTHIMTDFEHMDKVLKYNAGAFKKLFKEQELRARASVGGPVSGGDLSTAQKAAAAGLPETIAGKAYKVTEVGKDMAELMGRLWKFNVLLRLGYGPRAIADDFMGQAARFGAFSFFGERVVGGAVGMAGRNPARVGNVLKNWNKPFSDPTRFETRAASLESGVAVLSLRAQKIQQDIERTQSYLTPAALQGPNAARRAASHNRNLAAHNAKLDDVNTQIEALKASRNKLGETKAALGDRYVIMDDGTAFPRPFEGAQGAIYKDLNSGRRTQDNVLGGTATEIWNAYRTGDWRVYTANDAAHGQAWQDAVQRQIANDPAAMNVVNGMSKRKLEQWFSSPAGQAYVRDTGVRNMNAAERADRIHSHVNEYLPTHTPAANSVRMAVQQGAKDVEVRKLMDQVADVDKPAVQGAGLQYAMGKGDVMQHIDQMMTKFYGVMNQLPSEILSRNPLFNQLYRQHVSEIWSGHQAQGLGKMTPKMQAVAAESARKLALKDVKKFTFNMDFESKIAHNLRFIAPFFGPTQESFTRWGRIVADKPDALVHAAQIYTAPIHAGDTVDKNGNKVDDNGYVTNPDGSKTLVPKSEMSIRFQVPGWAAKGLGVDGGTQVNMPIDSLNLVLQNDPWFNPGTGPFVQISANYAALRTDPKVGDAMKTLGILPQGTKASSFGQALGSVPKALLGTTNTDKDQQQKDMIQIMQSEDYKFKNGLRDTEPTWGEVKEKASHGAMLRSWMKTVMPVSADFRDPYQFFRDRYRELMDADPKTADQVYLAKYGDAAFAFTGALTKSAKGLPATAEAVMADKKFASITDAHPDFANLIIGPLGQGDFSQTAYQQQLSTGERTKMTPQESKDSGDEKLGWTTFNKYMDKLTAQLYQAGFQTFSDKGAEGYAAAKKAVVQVLTSPTLADGVTKNRFYNEAFDKAYNTIDQTKDARNILALKDLVTTKELVQDPNRTDIQVLSKYLSYRDGLQQVLANRGTAKGGSTDINAKSNGDLKQTWQQVSMMLHESDTRFGALHDRWLSRDMFDHYAPLNDQQSALAAGNLTKGALNG